MANGPFTLAPGEEVVVGFALLGGDDLADLQLNTVTAQGVWSSVPVELVSFTADREDGHVVLNWATASESETYGFNVYRALGLDELRMPVNESVIPGAGNSSELRTYSFVDENVAANGEYYYWLEEVSLTGETELFGPAHVAMTGMPTSIVLLEPMPNPAATGASIRYTLTERTDVHLALYDLAGQMVHTFVNGSVPAGDHEVSWDAAETPRGVYLCRLDTPKETVSQTIVLMR
jgi:hypothetical protein